MKPSNNPKNRRGLLDYQKRQLELSRITEKEARQRRVTSNLEKWMDSLPPELKIAKPGNLHEITIDKIKKVRLKPPYEKQVLLNGSESPSGNFVAYAIIYALLNSGQITPSEIKKTSLLDGYNNINGMYQSRKWKDYFFDSKAKVLFIEGASKELTLLASRGEDQFWRELMEFTRNNDKLVIITYKLNEEELGKRIPIPTITIDYDLNSKLIKKSTFISLTTEEEEKIKNEQREVYESL